MCSNNSAKAQENMSLAAVDDAIASFDVKPAHEKLSETQKRELVWVARACWIEAEFDPNDCIATTWIAKKRAPILGVSWTRAMTMYSAIMKKNPRADDARKFPWGDIKNRDSEFNARWRGLRELITLIASNVYEDPCPKALHWGGKIDPQKPGMFKTQCIIKTINTFYGVMK